MKQLLLVCLLLAAGTGPLSAQSIILDFPFAQQTRTEQTFNQQRVGSGNKQFLFRLANGNRMLIEPSHLRQIDSLPPVDSLVAVCWRHLQTTGDTAQTPLGSKRVDAVFGLDGTVTMRVTTHPQPQPVYRIKGDDVTQLKLEQDTLRLRLFTRRATAPPLFWGDAMYVTFLVNHLADLPALVKAPGLGAAVAQLRQDVALLKTKKNRDLAFSKYNAMYDAATGKRIYPQRSDLRGVGRRNELLPYVQLGVQYLRGAWLPSAGAGFEWTHKPSDQFENRFQLFWEPYFVFGDDPAKATRVHRNDFVTLKWRQSSAFKTGGREFNFVQVFSAGYLVHRSGNRFEPNTVKFSVPGFQAKNILLEPEAVFNGWFKNFSPSLKLTLFLE